MEAYVEIIREDGTLERHRIEGDQITVGKSPTSGIPIPDGRDLEAEHLLIAPRAGDGCWVAVSQTATLQARVRGEAFSHGMVTWGTEIELGSIRVRVADSLPKQKKDEDRPSPVILIAGVAGAGLLVWSLMSGPGGPLIELEAPSESFQLFEETATCEAPGATALETADVDAEAALAHSERYPFDASDGIVAVRLYRRAEACYSVGGRAEAVTRMRNEGDWMKARIEEDFRTHRLRLQRSMAQRRWDHALLETRALLALTSHLEHPFVEWLRRNQRQLSLLVES